MSELKTKTQKKISRPMLGFWHIVFSLQPSWNAMDCYMIEFGILKMKKFPDEGEMSGKSNYKGFWLRRHFRLPSFIFTHNSKILNDSKK